MTEWNALPESLQLHIAAEALQHASRRLTQHAELLAGEMESGALRDRGGPDALRLLAAILRAASSNPVLGTA